MEQVKKNIDVAMGRIKADLVLKNARFINVFTQEVDRGDIAIVAGIIIGIGEYSGNLEINCSDLYVAPGFIDAHVHIESSMIMPKQFGEVVIKKGITTIIADPHEIANVEGIEGVKAMIESSKEAPIDIFFMLPSCVPATKFEDSGYVLNAEDLKELIDNNCVLGLGEVMDVPSVVNKDDELLKKIDMAKNKHIDGHCPSISPSGLNACISCGIKTDHECNNVKDALLKVSRGMYVMLREGSAAKNLKAVLPSVNNRNYGRFLYCSDDRHIDDLLERGSIDNCIRLSIKQGLNPIKAFIMASYNAAKCYDLHDRGAIAPGYKADLVIFEELKGLNILKVIKNGKEYKELPDKKRSKLNIKSSMHMEFIKSEIFKVESRTPTVNVIKLIPNSLETKLVQRKTANVDGYIKRIIDKDVLKIAVFERHHNTGKHFTSFIEGLGLKNCSIAQTIAHDSHNVIVVGDNEKDMEVAVNTLISIGGGIAMVSEGKVIAQLILPIGGIMTFEAPYMVAENLKRLSRMARAFGVRPEYDPFISLSFMTLPVIPEVKITARGLFDYNKFRFINSDVE
ncbi:adenine deaminase [Clostridium estertheticum]|uniref:Adenine deaminase n=1 Tax=Clostridium estertheticum subsp. estertheticum TaxID=1552 RepID=A0A1J0GKN7_9CLOT|nr:adenine deaminase [Clostridium estertheticum]APC41454.1 adenine deaminase [Clostridium estertheticum subsp. estertheticum]MBZ9616643.1 adenine deaminase [Clostridium estertheticum subsp. laramiense]WAG72363.1 adenine deaminase [Clostridium estertheticum]